MSLEFAPEIHRGASFFSVRFSFERKAGECCVINTKLFFEIKKSPDVALR